MRTQVNKQKVNNEPTVSRERVVLWRPRARDKIQKIQFVSKKPRIIYSNLIHTYKSAHVLTTGDRVHGVQYK
jgi:hypothetical protein